MISHYDEHEGYEEDSASARPVFVSFVVIAATPLTSVARS